MRDLKPIDLDAVQGRCDAATPGPWCVGTTNAAETARFVSENGERPHVGAVWAEFCEVVMEADAQDGDLELVAHSRTDLPHAVAILRHLRELAILEFGLDYQHEAHGNNLANAVLSLTSGGEAHTGDRSA